jgi:organic radical activating enzyme
MKIPHDKFCILPWVSLEASPIGTVRPCCLAMNEVCDDQGKKYKLGEVELDTIRDSSYMKNLRRAFLQGELPTDCDRCWNEEKSGRVSKRMHTLDRLKHIIDDSDWEETAKPLTFLDLKLGNICNLKCRICGSWSSSTYAVEEIQFQKEKKDNFHYVMLKLGRWPREEQKFWQDLERHLSGIQYLEFTGGEPFMISEHFELLKKLVDQGHSQNVEIHYNTNGTIFPAEAEEIWKRFRHVEIAFSIDDLGERFEYQRSNAIWSEVNSNLALFQEMRTRNPNITLQICTTINVYNILHLSEIAAWTEQKDFDFVYWNMLHDPAYLSISALPHQLKTDIKQHLHGQYFSPKYLSEINNAISFMDQGTSLSGEELMRNINLLDTRRNQSLQTVDPLLHAMLERL